VALVMVDDHVNDDYDGVDHDLPRIARVRYGVGGSSNR